MNPVCWIVLVITTIFCSQGWTAEAASAKTRAYLYQRETRAVLKAHHWHVSQDKAGRIVADHQLSPMYGSMMGLAWLTITFTPAEVHRTVCKAGIVVYLYGRTAVSAGKELSGPFPFNNPTASKEIQDMMAEAEKALEAKHPEYAHK